MYKVSSTFKIGDKYCVSVEGDAKVLKNGIKLCDEKGNNYIIESIGMAKYENIRDYERNAELILKGNIEDIGKSLKIVDL
jgi:hypothetical protein